MKERKGSSFDIWQHWCGYCVDRSMNDGLAGGGDGVEKFDRESGLRRREREREEGG